MIKPTLRFAALVTAAGVSAYLAVVLLVPSPSGACNLPGGLATMVKVSYLCLVPCLIFALVEGFANRPIPTSIAFLGIFALLFPAEAERWRFMHCYSLPAAVASGYAILTISGLFVQNIRSR